MVETKNERAALQKILTPLFEEEMEDTATVKSDVMRGCLQYGMIVGPLTRTQRGQNEFTDWIGWFFS
jgi:hypothetical protein